MSVHIISHRTLLLLFIAVLLPAFWSCKPNPTRGQCKDALRNRIHLLNKNNPEARANALREVDRLADLCVSGMKRESVLCDIAARNVKELNKCR